MSNQGWTFLKLVRTADDVVQIKLHMQEVILLDLFAGTECLAKIRGFPRCRKMASVRLLFPALHRQISISAPPPV